MLTVLLWCVVGAGALALLVAAINKKSSGVCRGLDIQINPAGKGMFLTKKDLVTLLADEGLKEPAGKPLQQLDLRRFETVLGRQPWIRDAQLYFDNNQVLHVRVTERQPAARIFTISGNSSYIDSSGKQMPLGGSVSLKLPVFTGYPAEKMGSRGDSALDSQIKMLTRFLNEDSFWSDAIQQVNITPAKTFEMVPLIGHQVIEFGDGNDYQDKFHRLMIFYRKIVPATGFEKYSRVSVQYDEQIVATRRGGPVSKADSIQALKNVLEIIRAARKMETDTNSVRDAKPLERNQLTEQNLQSYDFPEEKEDKPDPRNKH